MSGLELIYQKHPPWTSNQELVMQRNQQVLRYVLSGIIDDSSTIEFLVQPREDPGGEYLI